MMIRIILILSLCSIITSTVSAQMEQDTLRGGVIVIKDKRYQILSEKKAEINHKAMIARTPVKGFRLQIMNTTSRSEVLEAKSRMLSLYPEHKLYLIYQAPYFKLRMGNFKERNDAVELKNQIHELFPKGIYIIPSQIELKPEKEESLPPAVNPSSGFYSKHLLTLYAC